MPLYEYECKFCANVKQRLSVRADPLACKPGRCDECGSFNCMEPKLADAGLKFIGSGFHVNDYPKDSNTLPCVTQVAVGAPGEGGD